MCPAAIPAANYSHVKNFQNRKAYYGFYNIMVGIGEIGVITFANKAQALLVDYLRVSPGEARRRMCQLVSRPLDG